MRTRLNPARIAIGLALAVMLMGVTACSGPEQRWLANPALDPALLARLAESEPSDRFAMLVELQFEADDATTGFVMADPYRPATPVNDAECTELAACRYGRDVLGWREAEFPGRETVLESWHRRSTDDAPACGVNFAHGAANEYRLTTFPDVKALNEAEGYRLTHHGACGACSTLQDLVIYATVDLTHMAAQCARRLTLGRQKACMQAIGFSEACAESWAYNARHTRRRCARICLGELGWRAVLFGSEAALLPGEPGTLNACLECDELISGPGFQYSAGRTRRNSGIVSEIDRRAEEVRLVLHDYFD